jgi:predicted CopG family antitoxin
MVKVISLSEDAYSRLSAIKGNRSFSEVVLEFTSAKKNILDFAGAFADNSEEWGKIGKKLLEDREKAKLREVKF